MYKRVEKGIRESGNGTYAISIDLPPREGYKEKSYAFHLGTVDSLDKAREVRRKAEEICLHIGKNKALEPLQALKNSLNKKAKLGVSIGALERLLDDHDRIYGGYTLNDEFDEEYTEEIQEWKDEREALVMAIECLRKKL